MLALTCPRYGDGMRMIAFLTAGPTVRDLLVHAGAPVVPSVVTPARGAPPWNLPDGASGEGRARPAPEVELDQRVAC